MKNKIISVLTSKWAYFVYAVILAGLGAWQELLLGNQGVAWLMGLVIVTLFGALAEAFRYVATHSKYLVKNILPWIVGGVVGDLVIYAVMLL